MAGNPRKFSERIAMHRQKQEKDTAAYNKIIEEMKAAKNGGNVGPPIINNASPLVATQHVGHLSIPDRSLGAFRGGSLPNVNQTADGDMDASACQMMPATDQGIGLQEALNDLHSMRRGGDVSPSRSRAHTRQRSPGFGHHRHDISPYSSSNLLLPPHESSWRRANSDSAINQSPSREPFQQAVSPSCRRSTVNSCSQSEAMEQLGIFGNYDFDQVPNRPRSVGNYPDPIDFGQAQSPTHLTPPFSYGNHNLLSSSLPDLTNLRCSNPSSAHSQNASGVTSLDCSPESNYSDYHDDRQGSPVRSLHDNSNGSRLTNPQFTPPRITVEGLTEGTGSLTLENNSSGGINSPYSDGGAQSPLGPAPSPPLSLANPFSQSTTSLQGQNANLNQLNSQIPQMLNHNQQPHPCYDMMSNSMNGAPMANVGNGGFLPQSNGTAVANQMYDPTLYDGLVLESLGQIGGTTDSSSLQSYSDNCVQSPGSSGIPDIILTEPGAPLDDCSNNSTKVFSSSVGSGGVYYTPVSSLPNSPYHSTPDLPNSPHHCVSPLTPETLSPSELASQFEGISSEQLAELLELEEFQYSTNNMPMSSRLADQLH